MQESSEVPPKVRLFQHSSEVPPKVRLFQRSSFMAATLFLCLFI